MRLFSALRSHCAHGSPRRRPWTAPVDCLDVLSVGARLGVEELLDVVQAAGSRICIICALLARFFSPGGPGAPDDVPGEPVEALGNGLKNLRVRGLARTPRLSNQRLPELFCVFCEECAGAGLDGLLEPGGDPALDFRGECVNLSLFPGGNARDRSPEAN